MKPNRNWEAISQGESRAPTLKTCTMARTFFIPAAIQAAGPGRPGKRPSPFLLLLFALLLISCSQGLACEADTLKIDSFTYMLTAETLPDSHSYDCRLSFELGEAADPVSGLLAYEIQLESDTALPSDVDFVADWSQAWCAPDLHFVGDLSLSPDRKKLTLHFERDACKAVDGSGTVVEVWVKNCGDLLGLGMGLEHARSVGGDVPGAPQLLGFTRLILHVVELNLVEGVEDEVVEAVHAGVEVCEHGLPTRFR